MKVLRLGVSHDVREDIPFDDRQHVVAERILEDATGLEWETVIKSMWPTERLPELIERWVAAEEPDMVVLYLAGYWTSFGSTALRLERRVPFIGRTAANAARKLAESERAARHESLDRLRGVASRLIGVDFNFPPDELVERFEGIFRMLLRNEHLVVAVRGPGGPPQRLTKRQLRESRRRAELFRAGIADVCRRLHIEHLAYEELPAHIRIPGDPAHYTVEGARYTGTQEGTLMVRAWQRSQGQSRPRG
jgi:hypothetical protein